MTGLEGRSKVEQASIAATVIRKDGTREELGIVSYWHRNPLRRLWWRLRHGGKRNG